MKTKSSLLITAGLAAAIISPAFALEAPADDAPPPPLVAEKEAALPEIKLPAAPPHVVSGLNAERDIAILAGNQRRL